jgi:hypothetical protein
MPTSRPFAYNTGAAISGTIQVGNLAVGTPTSGFTGTPKWWNGADEELGYVIAIPVSGNTQPTPISDVTASVGFSRTSGFNTTEFVSLANRITGQSYTGSTQASTGLTSLGYWNSYPADDMGLYYKFDGNFNDSSGNYNNGTGFGNYTFSPSYAAKTGFTQGVGLSPPPYSAPYGGVSIPYSVTYLGNGGQNYSFFTWINRFNLGGGARPRQQIFNCYAYDGAYVGHGFVFNVGDTAGKGVQLIINDIPDAELNWSTLNRDTWYHIGFTIEDIGLEIGRYVVRGYLNGSLIASASTVGASVIRLDSKQTATISSPSSFIYFGAIDEMVIYNRTLSQTEITNLYNRTTPLL